MKKQTVALVIHYVSLMLVSLVSSASGVVLHSGGGEPLDRPNDAVLVRWSSNASAVVIGPSWLLTTRHQNTSPATVIIEDVTYHCVYHENWNGGQTGNADIRLVKLFDDAGEDAQLSNFAQIYTNRDEAGQYVVMGGYGRDRGNELDTDGIVYGYKWDPNTPNTTLRWCSNRAIGYTADLVAADFDGPGEGGATEYEGAVAEYDSGGGWFIKTDSIWKVTGLSMGCEHASTDESWFRNKNDPCSPDPDGLYAVRVSSYAAWILEKTADPVCTAPIPGDVHEDCKIDMLDLTDFLAQWLRNDCDDISYCEGADIEPDGNVDLVDFAILAGYWLECWLEPIEACGC